MGMEITCSCGARFGVSLEEAGMSACCPVCGEYASRPTGSLMGVGESEDQSGEEAGTEGTPEEGGEDAPAGEGSAAEDAEGAEGAPEEQAEESETQAEEAPEEATADEAPAEGEAEAEAPAEEAAAEPEAPAEDAAEGEVPPEEAAEGEAPAEEQPVEGEAPEEAPEEASAEDEVPRKNCRQKKCPPLLRSRRPSLRPQPNPERALWLGSCSSELWLSPSSVCSCSRSLPQKRRRRPWWTVRT